VAQNILNSLHLGRNIPLTIVFFSGETGETATFYVDRELCRFLSRRYPAALPTRKRGFGLVDGCKNFHAAALKGLRL